MRSNAVVAYQRARSSARHTPTFVLRLRERRLVARCRHGVPDTVVLANLAAVRVELVARTDIPRPMRRGPAGPSHRVPFTAAGRRVQ
jgi:hypothetical protein